MVSTRKLSSNKIRQTQTKTPPPWLHQENKNGKARVLPAETHSRGNIIDTYVMRGEVKPDTYGTQQPGTTCSTEKEGKEKKEF